MRLSVLSERQRCLARGVAIFLVGGFAAGCSSDVVRFQDGFYTGAMPTQQEVASAEPQQPYPSDNYDNSALVDDTYTGSIRKAAPLPAAQANSKVQRAMLAPLPASRNSARVLEPVGRAAVPSATQVARLPAMTSQPKSSLRSALPQRPSAALAPLARPSGASLAAATPRVDRSAGVDSFVTNSTGPSRDTAPLAPQAQGWTRTGGTQVTLRDGETLYNLSRRFGVPVKEIMKANGIANPSTVNAGQTIIIPTYVYSSKAPVSAPDNNPKTLSARSSRGLKSIPLPGEVPIPSRAPRSELAVLPQKPQERQPAVPASRQSPEPAASASNYAVQSGDTLYGIARKTGTTVTALKQANGLENGAIRVGQLLRLPGTADSAPSSATAAAPATAATKVALAPSPAGVDPIVTGTAGPAKKPTISARKTRQVGELSSYTPPSKQNDATKVAEKKTDSAPMRWPAQGRVISAFGSKSGGKTNDGIDIAVPSGTPVKAAENGVVIYAGDGLKEFGNTVLVRHSDGLVTVYGHASKLLVSRGDKVRRGQEIARSGMSGSAESPKLHFEVRKNSAPVNPARYLGEG